MQEKIIDVLAFVINSLKKKWVYFCSSIIFIFFILMIPIWWLVGTIMLIYSIATGLLIIFGWFKMKKKEKMFKTEVKKDEPKKDVKQDIEIPVVVDKGIPVVDSIALETFCDNVEQVVESPVNVAGKVETKKRGMDEIIEDLKKNKEEFKRLKNELIECD